jgi:hypothetical protein
MKVADFLVLTEAEGRARGRLDVCEILYEMDEDNRITAYGGGTEALDLAEARLAGILRELK